MCSIVLISRKKCIWTQKKLQKILGIQPRHDCRRIEIWTNFFDKWVQILFIFAHEMLSMCACFIKKRSNGRNEPRWPFDLQMHIILSWYPQWRNYYARLDVFKSWGQDLIVRFLPQRKVRTSLWQPQKWISLHF